MRISDWSSDVCSSDLVGAARGGISTICKLEGRIIALKIEHFEEVLRFRQLQLRRNALGERPRFQQAILRLVEFLVGNASLALNSLKVCNQIGRAHVCTPVTNAHLVCRLLLENNNTTPYITT